MIDPAVLQSVSLPLAIEDAVPVALSTAGFVMLARGVRTRHGGRLPMLALASAVSIGLGGSAKVIWKILAAGFERDVTWLDELLFPLLAIGFVGFVTLLVRLRRAPERIPPVSSGISTSTARNMAAVSALLTAGLATIGLDTTARLAMVLAITASLWISVHLIALARRSQDGPAAAMIAVNLAATLVLAGLAAVETQSLSLQWIEQSVNTLSQGLFLGAAIRLARPSVRWGPAVPAVPSEVAA